MSQLKLLLFRAATIFAHAAQAIVTGFGGGNGDPTVLMEPRSKRKRSKKPRTQDGLREHDP